MNNTTHIRTGRHVVFSLHAHLVFVTKYRKNVFNQPVFTDICNGFEAQLIEFGGEADHVHLLVDYPPKLSMSKLVNSLKGVSSRLLRDNFKQQVSQYYWKSVFWPPSYFASSCVGAPLDVIKKYIENQQRPFH